MTRLTFEPDVWITIINTALQFSYSVWCVYKDTSSEVHLWSGLLRNPGHEEEREWRRERREEEGERRERREEEQDKEGEREEI